MRALGWALVVVGAVMIGVNVAWTSPALFWVGVSAAFVGGCAVVDAAAERRRGRTLR